jgi:hypothetical protein
MTARWCTLNGDVIDTGTLSEKYAVEARTTFKTGTEGFGIFSVTGGNRVPNPAAKIIPLRIGVLWSDFFRHVSVLSN